MLESELALADTALTIDRRGRYVPSLAKQSVVVARGDVYLHNRSGARKSSGSYYTKPFAVEHLLDRALEPALNDHLARLESMDDTDAAESFFDFRVADIAMGSGHFLIGAIDRIEKRMSDWLARRSVPGVRRKLAALRDAAHRKLEDSAGISGIEDSQLLRRLIARSCIYGVDLNALSVQLARLAVWIHTFVPGLPLSFLDHNLIRGNSLVGIGTVDEIRRKFLKRNGEITFADPESLLGAAKKPLQRLANTNDATLADIADARLANREAREAVSPTERLCNLITAQPISSDDKVSSFLFEQWEHQIQDPKTLDAVEAALAGTHALHFPIAFPEVFLRDRPGFDVILGNPPWNEAVVEERSFWTRHFPGFSGLSQREQEAKKTRLRVERRDLVAAYEAERREMEQVRMALVGGFYPGMGTGDPDLYKAFCWRFWHLTAAEGGRIGVVLPRSALTAKGSTLFRRTMFERSAHVDVTMLLNRAGWVFDDAEHRYTIGLVCSAHGAPGEKSIHLRGPFASEDAFRQRIDETPAAFDRDDLLAWNDTASLPLLPDSDSIAVFAQLRKAPRLDVNKQGGGGWRARPDRELDATLQKELMVFDLPVRNGVPGPIPNSTPRHKKT